jgi:hypothetical protein
MKQADSRVCSRWWGFLITAGVFAVFASACSREEEVVVTNEGRVCAFGSGGPRSPADLCKKVTIEADRPLHFFVDMETCSDPCGHNYSSTCRVSRSGSLIDVTAVARWTEKRGRFSEPCTDACPMITAQCMLPSIPAGTYRVRYAGATFGLTVPSHTATACSRLLNQSRCCDERVDCGGRTCLKGNFCAQP